MMRTRLEPLRDEICLTAVFYALSDPVRLDIVRKLLSNTDVSCATLYADMPKSTRSYHFRVLRESGVTRTFVEGVCHRVIIRCDDLNFRFPGLLDVLNRASKPF